MISMEGKIQQLENRIKQLEAIVNNGNLQSDKLFEQRVTFKNGIIVENGYILFRSGANKEGVRIATGNASTNSAIATEQGNLPNGSLYLSNVTLQWPLFLKYNGTWIQVTLP